MGRRNLDGGQDGENRPSTVRLTPRLRGAVIALAEKWGTTESEAIRRALQQTAEREDVF